jgi:phosphomannomutase/phosphoglucomutase
MYYYAKKLYGFCCGIMITASHNPKEYNGFKISFDKIGNAYGKMIQDFKNFMLKGEFYSGNGELRTIDIRHDYIELLKRSLNLGTRKIKVVVDCGGGTASIIIKDILDSLNITYYPLYCESDPEFSHHHPDPSVPENMKDLSNKVKELNYHLGIAFDGDADRIGLVDELGNILQADIIMDLFYRDLKDKMPEKKAIYDVKCSNALIYDLKKMGYETLMYRTGNSYMNAKINQDNYTFGGEFAGHLWFKDRFPGFDDGIYAGLRLVELVSNTDKNISELLSHLPKLYATKEIKVKVTDESKFHIVEHVKKYALEKGYKVIDIDGVRVEFNDSFALVRASNTGPDLSVRFESATEERLKEIQIEFRDVIKKYLETH